MRTVEQDAPAIRIRFVMPGPELAPFVTTLYHMQVGTGVTEPLEDWLHPEWGNMRFNDGDVLQAGVGGRTHAGFVERAPGVEAVHPDAMRDHLFLGDAHVTMIAQRPATAWRTIGRSSIVSGRATAAGGR